MKTGFTTIELIVASGLVAILTLGMVMSISFYRGIKKIDDVQKFSLKTEEDLLRSLKEDLNLAVRADMEGSLPGISRIDSEGNPAGPRLKASDSDGIALYISKYDHFKHPIKSYTHDSNKKKVELIIQEEIDSNSEAKEMIHNISRFVKKALAQSQYALISNSYHSYIAKIEAFDPANATLTISAPVIDMEVFKGEGISVVPLRRVEWSLDKEKNLVKKEYMGDPKTILKEVEALQIDYQFKAAGISEDELTVINPEDKQYLSHIYDPQYIKAGEKISYNGKEINGVCNDNSTTSCCTPSTSNCISWRDIESTRIKVKFNIDEDLKPVEKEKLDGTNRYELSGSQLQRNAIFKIFPDKYNSRLVVEAVIGKNVDCSPLNPVNRCNQKCSMNFTSDNREAPDWVGYGRYVGSSESPASYYCQCGTEDGGEFTPPETKEGLDNIPKFEAGGDNSRLEACVQHFDMTASVNSGWIDRHPLMRVVKNKISRDKVSKYYEDAPTGHPNLALKLIKKEAFHALKVSYEAWRQSGGGDTTWQEDLYCRLDPLFGDARLQEFYQLDGSFKPYADYCNCRGSLSMKEADPNFTCNHNLFESEPRCSTTWTGEVRSDVDSIDASFHQPGDPSKKLGDGSLPSQTKTHRVFKVSNENTPDDKKIPGGGWEEAFQGDWKTKAGTCQCLQETHYTKKIPHSHGHMDSVYWNFLTDDPDFPAAGGDPSLNGYVEEVLAHHVWNPGSLVPLEVKFYYDDGSSSVKNETYTCGSMITLSDCISPDQTCAVLYESNPTKRDECYSAISPEYKPAIYEESAPANKDYSSWCSSACWQGPAPTANSNIFGIQLARMEITNAASLDELPKICNPGLGVKSVEIAQ